MPARADLPCNDQPCRRPRAKGSTYCLDHRNARRRQPGNRRATATAPNLSVLIPDHVRQGGVDAPLPTFEDVARLGWNQVKVDPAAGVQWARVVVDALKAIDGQGGRAAEEEDAAVEVRIIGGDAEELVG